VEQHRDGRDRRGAQDGKPDEVAVKWTCASGAPRTGLRERLPARLGGADLFQGHGRGALGAALAVRIAAALRPKQPRVFVAALGVVVLLAAAHAIGLARGRFDPGRGLGLAIAILAAGYVFAAAYSWRRRARACPARFWTQAHVYVGGLAAVAALLHTGLAWPQGVVETSLLLLTGWTTLTGVLGVALQKGIPSRLTEGLRVEVLLERIPELRERLVAAADARMQGAGEVLARHYRQELRPRLERPHRRWRT
jgi:hypothetical protein